MNEVRPGPLAARQAFTLVELLVVIADPNAASVENTDLTDCVEVLIHF
jgi:hypothetical protein